MQQKIQLRKKYLNLRKKKYFNIDKSFFLPLIKLLRLKFKKKIIKIALYYPSNFELDVLKILEYKNFSIQDILLPAIDKNNFMNFFSWSKNDILFVSEFGMLEPMYRQLETVMHNTNKNHFGFDNMQLTEQAQYTEYSDGGFYNWHMDNGVNFESGNEPVRKISMSLLLNHESEFDGGDLELCEEGKVAPLKQGHAIFFASFLNHRVKPVTRGTRKSLVMWFGGTPFK